MPELSCTVKRIGDYESRTEEYEVAYAVGQAPPHGLHIRYQAARVPPQPGQSSPVVSLTRHVGMESALEVVGSIHSV